MAFAIYSTNFDRGQQHASTSQDSNQNTAKTNNQACGQGRRQDVRQAGGNRTGQGSSQASGQGGSAGKDRPRKKAAAPAKAGARKKAAPILLAQRNHYVEIAAYYIAERHGFTPGREVADWAEAEAEIDRLLGGGHFNP